MKDNLGQELNIDDDIIMTRNYKYGEPLIRTKVLELGGKGIHTHMIKTPEGYKNPNNCIKINLILDNIK